MLGMYGLSSIQIRVSDAMHTCNIQETPRIVDTSMSLCIDGYSKYLMTRKLKSKSATEVTHAMKDIIQTYGPPKHICADRGTEFTNTIFRTNILDKYDITMYHMDSANKAVLAERAIRFIHM